MTAIQEKTEQATAHLIEVFGENYSWQWDERMQMRLSEFAANKQTVMLDMLASQFEHHWHHKNIKKAPTELLAQLGDLKKLKPQQRIFTSLATEDAPALMAVWWPWGHGSTISLRLALLEEGYQLSEMPQGRDNFFTVIKKLFTKEG